MLVIDRAFGSLVDQGSLFLLLSTAVIATAWVAGTGPALAATIVGALLAGGWTSVSNDAATHARLVLFILQGLVLTGIVSELRRARRTAEKQAYLAEESRREGEAASRMKDEFLGTISHELRTPLNAVLGWAHLLRTGKLDATARARGLEAIERNARLQAQLTGNLLDISRAMTGRLRVECRPVSLTEIVRQVAVAALPAAHAKGVRVAHNLPDTSVALLGDWGRLRQVVVAAAGKRAEVHAERRNRLRSGQHHARSGRADGVRQRRRNRPAFLPKIFDRFTQEDASPLALREGSALACLSSGNWSNCMAARFAAANRSDTHGADFHRSISPSANTDDRTGRASVDVVRAEFQVLEGLRVLVLDRDRDARELLEAVLRQGGSRRTTESVADALDALETWRPDVLVSDRASPDRDCYLLVGKVASLEADRGGRIPAVALTSLAGTDTNGSNLLARSVRDLPKPLEPALLTAEVARLAGRGGRRASR